MAYYYIINRGTPKNCETSYSKMSFLNNEAQSYYIYYVIINIKIDSMKLYFIIQTNNNGYYY
jgi:hypothetical protein